MFDLFSFCQKFIKIVLKIAFLIISLFQVEDEVMAFEVIIQRLDDVRIPIDQRARSGCGPVQQSDLFFSLGCVNLKINILEKLILKHIEKGNAHLESGGS